MTRSIGTFQRFKHDDVMRATHSVSVISHSLHDCIGPNRVRPPHTAVHLLRPPLVPPPTRRFRRHRCQPADVDVAGSSPPSSSSPLPPPPPPPLPLPPTPSIEKRPVLYAPAHTLYLACVLNARERCLSFCPHSAAYPHALLPPRCLPLLPVALVIGVRYSPYVCRKRTMRTAEVEERNWTSYVQGGTQNDLALCHGCVSHSFTDMLTSHSEY
ncbi:hypothetical protein ALC62_11802 [Cyphomyrmex costatus]|uniref:Uncharacterized protein n=1 Tax=Cyphomyrmex costatus TaxID=456900 RepID=A0A195CBM0_9HYME|nr:hypothetical protein ALC62_11802 [Cyphomyrmex costatus]